MLSETVLNTPAEIPSIVQMSCPVPVVVHWNVTEPPGHMVPVGDVSRVVAVNVKKFNVDFQDFKNLIIPRSTSHSKTYRVKLVHAVAQQLTAHPTIMSSIMQKKKHPYL